MEIKVRRTASGPWFAFGIGLLVGLAAGCGGGSGGQACTTSSDCVDGGACIDGRCVAPGDAAPPDAGGEAGPEGGIDASRGDAGDGGDSGPECPSGVLCGAAGTCCAEGEECIEGACLPACPSGVRCGADRTTCCGAGEVCLSSSCIAPGGACTDSFDCDAGAFCEPTLGRCLPQFEPVACELRPVFGSFEVTEEWSVTTAMEVPDCMQAIVMPLVVDLDGDEVPEVVLNTACDSDWQQGVLRAFRGADGTPLWTVSDPSLRTNGRSTPAAGDLDGDGRPEIVVLASRNDRRLLAFDADGTLAWVARNADGEPVRLDRFANGAVTLADLDADGRPEVVTGAMVFDATGLLRWRRDGADEEGTNSNYWGGISAAADLDGDGLLEVVPGRRAYEHDGMPKWTGRLPGGTPVPDGYPAVAQFDDDVQPEVVLVASGDVYLLDGLSGEVQWGPVAIPGGGRGGPPTVADFDGDGLPEIGVAGANSYSVYDPTGDSDVLWSRETVDASSNATGSSVFDFEGDGAAEVVYADECHLWVYRGSDGETLLQVPNSSATIHEYPLVVDVDADGNSEILLVANDRAPTIETQCSGAYAGWDGNRRGLFVYGDARDQWVRTRRIWNEHAYHVTNVGPDGTVASPEPDNWTLPGLNNYRQNVQGEGVFNAPDLVLLGLSVELEGCPERLRLVARVANEGALGVPAGVAVAFYEGSEAMPGALLGVQRTSGPLLPGESETVSLEVDVPAGEPPYGFFARVDDDGTGMGGVAECDEDDGAASIASVQCPRIM